MVKIHNEGGPSRRFKAMASAEATALVGKALYAFGDMIKAEARRSITAGAISGKGHVPSVPGQPPNADTHALDRQIETMLVGPLKVEVSSNAPHAIPMEAGTSSIQERPYMRPAVRKKKAEGLALVAKAIQRANRMVG